MSYIDRVVFEDQLPHLSRDDFDEVWLASPSGLRGPALWNRMPEADEPVQRPGRSTRRLFVRVKDALHLDTVNRVSAALGLPEVGIRAT